MMVWHGTYTAMTHPFFVTDFREDRVKKSFHVCHAYAGALNDKKIRKTCIKIETVRKWRIFNAPACCWNRLHRMECFSIVAMPINECRDQRTTSMQSKWLEVMPHVIVQSKWRCLFLPLHSAFGSVRLLGEPKCRLVIVIVITDANVNGVP